MTLKKMAIYECRLLLCTVAVYAAQHLLALPEWTLWPGAFVSAGLALLWVRVRP